MRIVRPRAVIEFVGGPADGTRIREPVDQSTGRPPDIWIWPHVIHEDGMPVVHTDVVYELRPAPGSRYPIWQYVLPGSSEDFGFDPDADDDDAGEADENAQER